LIALTSLLDIEESTLYSHGVKQAWLNDKETRPVKSTDDSLGNPSASRRGPQHRRVTLWAFVWALSYVAAALGIKKEWWPQGVSVAVVVASALLGVATILAYRRFLQEADELRRKIELEALAIAFGAGAVGGLTYWLLVASGAAPAADFVFVLVAMVVIHPVGVLIGCRRYS
jgi:hypothetical protein